MNFRGSLSRLNLALLIVTELHATIAEIGTLTVTSDLVLPAVAGGLAPVGSIVAWPHTAPPAGWLFCNGAAVSRTTYAALFALIGTYYGAGDGVTTFNVPDARGRMIVGVATAGTASTLGATGGALDHTHTETQHSHIAPAHQHTGPSHVHTGPSHTHNSPTSGAGSSHSHGSGTYAAASHSHGAGSLYAGSHGHTDTFSGSSGGPSSTVTRTSTGLATASSTHSHAITISGAVNSSAGIFVVSGSSGTAAPDVAGTSSSEATHTHPGGATDANGTGDTGAEGTGLTGSGGGSATGLNAGTSTGANNPPYLALNWIIRT